MVGTGENQGKIDMHLSDYWNQYYLKNFNESPSDFAIFCLKKYLSANQSIIDAGCGSAQDGLFFCDHGLQVISIDKSQVVIDKLKNKYSKKNIDFVIGDITKELPQTVDNIYSRWTLHAMPWKMSSCFLKNAYESLNLNGKLFIECRSALDCEAKKVQSHYRNFIRIKDLKKIIKKLNMTIIFLSEQQGLSRKENGDDPLLIRLVAIKK